MIPVILGHTPAGASTKQYLHYAQNVRSKRFQQYDYDSAIANYRVYGSWKPPLYKVENIRAPIVFFYAVQDTTTNHADIDDLARRLPNLKAKFVVQDPDFTHVDFIYGMHVRSLIYDRLVEIMRESDERANLLWAQHDCGQWKTDENIWCDSVASVLVLGRRELDENTRIFVRLPE